MKLQLFKAAGFNVEEDGPETRAPILHIDRPSAPIDSIGTRRTYPDISIPVFDKPDILSAISGKHLRERAFTYGKLPGPVFCEISSKNSGSFGSSLVTSSVVAVKNEPLLRIANERPSFAGTITPLGYEHRQASLSRLPLLP